MPKRISTGKFQKTIGRISRLLADDESMLYVIVENRRDPRKSMAVINAKWFTALLRSCDDIGVADEGELLEDVMEQLKVRTRESFRERVMCRYNK